jgi:hypothetical protein
MNAIAGAQSQGYVHRNIPIRMAKHSLTWHRWTDPANYSGHLAM